MLDGTEITETTRQFLRSWQANKDAVKQRLESNSGLNGQQSSAAGSIGTWPGITSFVTAVACMIQLLYSMFDTVGWIF